MTCAFTERRDGGRTEKETFILLSGQEAGDLLFWAGVLVGDGKWGMEGRPLDMYDKKTRDSGRNERILKKA